MKRLILTFILGCLFWSCSKSIEKPENLLSTEQIETILTDVHLYQQPSYLTTLYNQPINHAKIDAQILVKHQVSSKVFEESFKYYVLQPEIFKEILVNVRKKLIEKLPQEERDKLNSEKKSKDDSKN